MASSPFYEYFIILGVLFVLSYTAPTLIKLLNTVTGGDDDKKGVKKGPSMITQIAKGMVMLACVYMVNVPVSILLSGRNSRNNFFRPALAREQYQMKMAEWRSQHQPTSVVKVELQQAAPQATAVAKS